LDDAPRLRKKTLIDSDALLRHQLSRRGTQIVHKPPLAPYILEHFSRTSKPWHAQSCPDGYIALSVAENKMMWDVLVPRLASYRDVPSRVLGYDTMIGALAFRQKLAAFMGRRFLGRPITPEQLAVVAGAGSVLELLFYAIADPGDAVLVPTPSYAGFWADLETRDELTIVPVHGSSSDGFRLTIEGLDRALAAADRPVKALLFTTPDNPLGRVYRRGEIREVLDWALGAGLHVVFDEIYALSVFGTSPFVSVASLRPCLGERVHVVWAFSKDFGASGLRCGVLLSENEGVLRTVDGLAYWSACSGDTQYLLGELISDESWVDGFLLENQKRLRRAYRTVTRSLDEQGIRYLPAEGGFFLICDLRPFLEEATWAAEDRLWRLVIERANVNLTPGSACRIVEPGFFRLCYGSEPTAALETGVERLGNLLRSR
jgi:aspartate/methionine/tyrosine aminotransferase